MSYVDAVVIAACVRRPIRFVMDHRIFPIPVLSFIFRAMRTIPIAPAREDAAMKDRAFAEAARRCGRARSSASFRRASSTETGELNPFRPGVQQMVATTPVPVIPLALSGLWGSFFSRSHQGKAMRRVRGIFSRIALRAGPPVPPERDRAGGAARRSCSRCAGERR